MLALTVTMPFGEYAVGDTITDKDAIKTALAETPSHVVRVNRPDPDKTAPSKPPADKASS